MVAWLLWLMLDFWTLCEMLCSAGQCTMVFLLRTGQYFPNSDFFFTYVFKSLLQGDINPSATYSMSWNSKPFWFSHYINFGGDPGHSVFPDGWYNLLWPTTNSSAMSTVPWENKMFSLTEDSEGKIDVKCSSFPFNASFHWCQFCASSKNSERTVKIQLQQFL